MDKFERHLKQHAISHSPWLRAAVLGANDGVLSIASILTGIAAGGADHNQIMLAGIAALVAGASSMAAGEYVSVSSQRDIETGDLAKEKHALETNLHFEMQELAHIYEKRGLDPSLAKEVASQLMAHDALGAHARDELGISETVITNPFQAALSSGLSFTAGALLPLLTAGLSPTPHLSTLVVVSSLTALALLGAVAGKISGTSLAKPMLRIVAWGAFSMGFTAAIGALTGVTPS